jgi:hypothetical protein
MSIKYLDIALFPCTSNPDEIEKYPILNKEITISDNLWIAPINGYIEKAILEYCEPRGLFDKYENQDGKLEEIRPIKTFQISYAFAREKPPESDKFNWDIDHKLKTLIALSRIIHPTSISFEYSAKLKFNDNELVNVIPGRTSGPGSKAYVADGNRDWLTIEDAEELKKLYSAYTKRKFCDSCRRAMWFFEYASQTYFLEVRCLLIATGIESLINTDQERPTKQFSYRVPKLCELLNNNFDLSGTKAAKMYTLRSKLAHGEKIGDNVSKNLELYKQMEDILRFSIKKFIFEDDFYSFISDKDKVRSKWVLPIE